MHTGHVSLLTGPNNSGKTVYLRQVGLITYMAHLGSFVPAAAAKIGLTDRIMTRIQTHESVSVQKSTFTIDLLQMNQILKLATNRTLVLIDEFGKGTLSIDGAGLLCATMKHFMNSGNPTSNTANPSIAVNPLQRPAQQMMVPRGMSNCPRVFVTTHFLEILDNDNKIFAQELQQGKLEINMMQVFVEGEGELNQNVVYLYKKVPWMQKNEMSQNSEYNNNHAIHCARRVGVPDSVLTRTVKLIQDMKQNKAIVAPAESPYSREHELKSQRVLQELKSLDCNNRDKVLAFMNMLKTLDQGNANDDVNSMNGTISTSQAAPSIASSSSSGARQPGITRMQEEEELISIMDQVDE